MQLWMPKLVHSVRLSLPHVDRVRPPCTIRRPDPRNDRARPELLTTIAVAASGAGMLLALLLARVLPGPNAQLVSMDAALGQLRPEPPRSAGDRWASEAEPEVSTTEVAAATAPPARAANELVAANASTPPMHPPAVLKDEPAPPPKAPAPNVAAAPKPDQIAASAPAPKRRREKREFTQGTVAYVRCGSGASARATCPRDRKFEEQVWQTLAKLPACDADPGTGSAEIRWHMNKPDATGIEWKIAADASLNTRALARCAGEKLGTTRTRLRAQQALVYFRFSLK